MKPVLQRTCIGCLTKRPKEKLVRLVVRKGQVEVDLTGQAVGRGAYLCRNGQGINQTCLKLAQEKNAFSKAFKKKISSINLPSNKSG